MKEPLQPPTHHLKLCVTSTEELKMWAVIWVPFMLFLNNNNNNNNSNNNNCIERCISRFFYNLFTAPWTDCDMYVLVAAVQLCANHVRHIGPLSRATCPQCLSLPVNHTCLLSLVLPGQFGSKTGIMTRQINGLVEELTGWLIDCLTSQQHASDTSQGRICSDNLTCCHTEIEVADQTFYLTHL